jgi:hypothetical protein
LVIGFDTRRKVVRVDSGMQSAYNTWSYNVEPLLLHVVR